MDQPSLRYELIRMLAQCASRLLELHPAKDNASRVAAECEKSFVGRYALV
jgi:hypothetical protein